jgi:hypothetical protein
MTNSALLLNEFWALALLMLGSLPAIGFAPPHPAAATFSPMGRRDKPRDLRSHP